MSKRSDVAALLASVFAGAGVVHTYAADEAVEDGTLAPLPPAAAPAAAAAPLVPKFDLGRVLATPGAVAEFGRDAVCACVERHNAGDWGDVEPSDRRANDRDLRDGGRLLSAYQLGEGRDRRLWVLTEADRSHTTAMLPSEY